MGNKKRKSYYLYSLSGQNMTTRNIRYSMCRWSHIHCRLLSRLLASQCVLNVDLYYYTAYSTIEQLLEGQWLHCCEVITIVSANLLKVITVYLKGQFTCQVMLLYELRRLTRVYHFLSTDAYTFTINHYR